MGLKLGSRIYTNSFTGKDQEMTYSLKTNKYFGFQNKTQYAYNLYRQLTENGAGAGSRGARWARVNNIQISFLNI